MDLVNEEDDVLRLDDIVHDILETLLELAAVLCPCHERRHRQCDDALVLEEERHLTVRDALGKPLCNCGLADPRLPEEDGVVLRAARKNLNHAIDLCRTPNDGIEPAHACDTDQVTSEFLEGGGQPLAPLVRFPARGLLLRFLHVAHALEHLALQFLDVDIQLLERMDGSALRLREQTEQDVLRRHEGTLLAGGVDCALHDALGTSCIVRCILDWLQDILKPVRIANHLLRAVIIRAEFIQHLRCNRVAHMHDSQQKLACSDVPLATPLRNIL